MGIVNRLKIASAFIMQQPVVAGFPVEIGIEMTNRCNLRCKMCAREAMTRPVGDMPLTLLKKIIDEVSGYAEMIYLHGDGEPLLHKDIFEAIAYVKGSGVKVALSTNATLLNEEKSRRLIAAEPDYLILAIDGATKPTYEGIRINGCFEEVVANAERFLDLKRKSNSRIHVLVQFIAMKENTGEVTAFIDHWKKFKPDCIRIKSCVDLVGKKGVTIFQHPCFYLWRQIMIDWDGTVFPCCVDTNSLHHLGNLAEVPLADIWNGPLLQAMRKKHIQGGQAGIDICRNCDMNQFTIFTIAAATLVDGYQIKKYLPYWERLFPKAS